MNVIETYVLIPLDEYTISNTIESISTRNSFKDPTFEGICRTECNARRATDMDGNTYIIARFGISYPVSCVGYKKYTKMELIEELEDIKWAHNNEVLAQ